MLDKKYMTIRIIPQTIKITIYAKGIMLENTKHSC